ncbi:ABC transporter substrate-binding protein [Erysipelothrix sp. HDW6C]|uniref:ABC transporter substrate-binding protein n=1 Tax=Erysipelothrix sp. HDW6C TaxID=2714930 RepID=UPI00140B9B22|nr:ABC transporter substrate-binding protein [Erysipelothrix sp. HDW6C]QIK69726.1 ABC transporter substrate-binding protein [Erysipelothrix sp. HDW6C]
MKKILILLTLFILVGCSSAPKVNETPIRVGTLPAEAALPIIIAQEKGMFEAHGVKIEITPFGNPQERNAAAQAGEIDGMIADVMTGYTFQDKGMPYVITSDINEDFKILASPNSGITTMSQLDGKEVALIPGLILEYVMDEIAQKDSFSYNVLAMPSFPGRFEGLLSDQFAGVVFTEPQAGMLVQNGAILLGSSSQYGIKGGSLLFHDDVVTQRSDDLKRFYAAYNEAVAYLNDNPSSEYSDLLTKYQFPEQMGAYIDNKKEAFGTATAVSQDQLDKINTWSQAKGLIDKPADLEKAVNFEAIN